MMEYQLKATSPNVVPVMCPACNIRAVSHLTIGCSLQTLQLITLFVNVPKYEYNDHKKVVQVNKQSPFSCAFRRCCYCNIRVLEIKKYYIPVLFLLLTFSKQVFFFNLYSYV